MENGFFSAFFLRSASHTEKRQRRMTHIETVDVIDGARPHRCCPSCRRRRRLGRQQFEEHQCQRQVDDQYYQHQLLSREPVLQQ